MTARYRAFTTRFPWKLFSIGVVTECLWVSLALVAFRSNFFPALDDTTGTLFAYGVQFIVLLGLAVMYWLGWRVATTDIASISMVLVFAVLFAVTLQFIFYPIGSSDLILYTFYARAALFYDADLYLAVPNDFPNDITLTYLPERWHAWPLTYGPVFALLSLVPIWLSGHEFFYNLIAFKFLNFLFWTATLYLVYGLAEKLKSPTATKVTLYLFAWNPLVLYEVIHNGHNDIMLMFFMMLSFFLLATGRFFRAWLFFLCSVLIKYSSLIVGPLLLFFILFRSERKARRYMWAGIAGTMLFALVFFLSAYVYFPALFAGLTQQSRLAEFQLSGVVPVLATLLAALFSDLELDALVVSLHTYFRIGLILCWCALMLLATRQDMSVRQLVMWSCWLFALFIFFESWIFPWYLLWILPQLIVLGQERLVVALTAIGVVGGVIPMGILLLVFIPLYVLFSTPLRTYMLAKVNLFFARLKLRNSP